MNRKDRTHPAILQARIDMSQRGGETTENFIARLRGLKAAGDAAASHVLGVIEASVAGGFALRGLAKTPTKLRVV